MVRQQGPEPELWIGVACELAGIERRAGQEYVTRGVLVPREGAVGRGGRHTFGKIEVVQLAVTGVLAENGVPLQRISDYFARIREKGLYLSKLMDWELGVRPLRQPIRKTIIGSGKAEGVSFDPTPYDEAILEALRDEYVDIRAPEKVDHWPSFWSTVRQLASPTGSHEGNEAYQVLLPKRLTRNKFAPDSPGTVVKRRQAAIHDFLWDSIALDGMEEVSTAMCLIDLAAIKARVGKQLIERGWMGPYVKGMGVIG